MIYIRPWYRQLKKKQLKDAGNELAEKTPAPMNTMLTKQSREEEEMKGRNATCGCSPNKPRCVKLNSSYKVILLLNIYL